MRKIKVYINTNELANWDKVFKQQMDLIRSSGLGDVADEIMVMGNGREYTFLPFLKQWPDMPNVSFVKVCTGAHFFEYSGLDFMQKQCKQFEEPYDILYLHMKGLTRWGNPAVDDWRNFMNWSVIEQWKQCVEALKECDAVGPNLDMEPWVHFSGNFWWAKSEWIAQLPELIHPERLTNMGITQFKSHPEIPHFRFDHEAWVCSAPNGKVKQMHRSFDRGERHYTERYPRNLYAN